MGKKASDICREVVEKFFSKEVIRLPANGDFTPLLKSDLIVRAFHFRIDYPDEVKDGLIAVGYDPGDQSLMIAYDNLDNQRVGIVYDFEVNQFISNMAVNLPA
jgi:hypothetical protein